MNAWFRPRRRVWRRRRLLAGGLVVPAMLASGCGTPSVPASTTGSVAVSGDQGRVIEGHLRSGGLVRSYRVYVPSQLRLPAPLVVVLHGGLQTPDGVAEMTGFDRAAEREGFLAVYPAG